MILPALGGEIDLNELHANERYTFTVAHKPGYDLQPVCGRRQPAANGDQRQRVA